MLEIRKTAIALEEEELLEYFLCLLEDFLEDILLCLDAFFSNLFLSFVEEGLESGEGDLLVCFEDFFLDFGILEWKLRGPPEDCITAAGSTIKAGSPCWERLLKIGVLFPCSDFCSSDSSSVCLPSPGYSTELVPESSL